MASKPTTPTTDTTTTTNDKNKDPSPSSRSPPPPPKNKTIDRSKLVFGSDDVLFGCIEQNQQTAPLGPSFGSLLDAGTGSHSLRWIASLLLGAASTLTTNTAESFVANQAVAGGAALQYTAVTADDTMRRNVVAEAESLGIEDRGDVIIGNWKTNGDTKEGGEEEELCRGELYDTILADYLVGAIDGFSPYYQDQIFPRLTKHLKPGGRMYVVGLNPIPDKVEGDANLFCRVTKLRDACILLASHRCYREYPPDWIERHMKAAGLTIIDRTEFPIMYTHATIVRQLNVARSKLKLFESQDVAKAMGKQIDDLEKESLVVMGKAKNGKMQLGFDYVVTGELPVSGGGDGGGSGLG